MHRRRAEIEAAADDARVEQRVDIRVVGVLGGVGKADSHQQVLREVLERGDLPVDATTRKTR